MNAQPHVEEEFCPNCGHWVPQLDDVIGWCGPCTRRSNFPVTVAGTGTRHCNRCKTTQPREAFSSTAHYCRACETDQKRLWRIQNPERERAYQAQRPRGRCPECLQMTWLTKTGVLTNHIYRMRRIYSGERCDGSGQPPKLGGSE